MKTDLNQDRTAINHNGLPSSESFLHQEQIGLRDFVSLADSANRETLAHGSGRYLWRGGELLGGYGTGNDLLPGLGLDVRLFR